MDETGMKSLAATIVFTAVYDWNLLKRKKLETYKIRRSQVRISVSELKEFFNSTWFDSLADILGMDSEKMLNKLGI